MKAFVAITVANEIDGRFSIVRVEKAMVNRDKMQEWSATRPGQWREAIRQDSVVIDCHCQLRIIEVEVEDN